MSKSEIRRIIASNTASSNGKFWGTYALSNETAGVYPIETLVNKLFHKMNWNKAVEDNEKGENMPNEKIIRMDKPTETEHKTLTELLTQTIRYSKIMNNKAYGKAIHGFFKKYEKAYLAK